MKKLIFDLDGTLYRKDERGMLPTDIRAIEFLRNNAGLGQSEAEKLWQELAAGYKYGIMDFEKTFAFSRDDFCNYVCDLDDMSYAGIIDGLNDALLSFAQDKYIFTDNTLKQTIKTLNYLRIDEGHFKVVFDAKSGDYLFKPNLVVYEKFLQENNLEAKDCIMFEDTVSNLKPAKDLGMVTVLISDKDDKYNFCDYYFTDVLQALSFLKDKI